MSLHTNCYLDSTTQMALRTRYYYDIKRREFDIWIPLLKRAYNHVVCDIVFYFDEYLTNRPERVTYGRVVASFKIYPDKLQDLINAHENINPDNKIVGFELTTPRIWGRMVGWRFMPIIDAWTDTITIADTPQSLEDIEVCSTAINTLNRLLSYQPSNQSINSDEWNCPLKFIKYVCTQAHQHAESNRITAIFFQQYSPQTVYAPTHHINTRNQTSNYWKMPVIEYDLLLQSNTGCRWRLNNRSYTNHTSSPDLTLHLKFGFSQPATIVYGRLQRMLPKYVDQFEEWKQNGCHGEIFKLLHPVSLTKSKTSSADATIDLPISTDHVV